MRSDLRPGFLAPRRLAERCARTKQTHSPDDQRNRRQAGERQAVVAGVGAHLRGRLYGRGLVVPALDGRRLKRLVPVRHLAAGSGLVRILGARGAVATRYARYGETRPCAAAQHADREHGGYGQSCSHESSLRAIPSRGCSCPHPTFHQVGFDRCELRTLCSQELLDSEEIG